jgi:hypothetical protein
MNLQKRSMKNLSRHTVGEQGCVDWLHDVKIGREELFDFLNIATLTTLSWLSSSVISTQQRNFKLCYQS